MILKNTIVSIKNATQKRLMEDGKDKRYSAKYIRINKRNKASGWRE